MRRSEAAKLIRQMFPEMSPKQIAKLIPLMVESWMRGCDSVLAWEAKDERLKNESVEVPRQDQSTNKL
jgi:hypothetical protein